MHEHDKKCHCDCKKTPFIGDAAPEFEARTTNGYIKFPHDFRGKWIVFFSHPGDFTPVCTTEFIAFQAMIDEFRTINTELVGLSVDSLSSHLAWINSIKNDVVFENLGDVEITFPIIADSAMDIAEMYGMVHDSVSKTSTVRSVFIIDPRGIIRVILHYPQSIGRNITEIKRILIALQTSDAFQVVIPAEWIPGDAVIDIPPRTTSEVKNCKKGKPDDKNAWFMNFKQISPEMILEKITNQKLLKHDEKHKKEKEKYKEKDKKRK